MQKQTLLIRKTLKTLLVILSLTFSQFGFSQSKPLSITRLKNLEVKTLICIDSAGAKTQICSLGLDGFHVEFYKAFFDARTEELRIIGRLNPSHASVGIFIGNNDSIPLKKPISRTAYDKENLNNDGFFDVSFKIQENSVLYFYERPYFAKQYNISKLLELK